MHETVTGRRRFLLAGAALALATRLGRAQQAPRELLADMHSHFGMFRHTVRGDLRAEMMDTGTTLLAWAIVDDSPYIAETPQGMQQVREPAPGELWAYFQRRAADCDVRLAGWHLPKVFTPADVDAAVAGEPHVVMASESANFLEGQPERLARAHAMGLRHLQLVHFIASPLGDRQTEAPRHDGMPAVTATVIAECKRLGIVVDLAHAAPALVDAALAASDATMIWSHSWIGRRGGLWRDPPNVARALSPEQARRIVAHGGIVGLWSVRVRSEGVRDADSYADEISRMVDLVGPQGVGFGTDMDGAGSNPVLAGYADLRRVADRLAQRGMSPAVLHDVCIGNYARVLKKAMGA